MTKLEKSVRSALHYYMNDLKARKYWVSGDSGATPDGWRGFIGSVYADTESGECTDITIYTSGDNGRAPRHAYMEDGVIDVTETIEAWLSDSRDYSSLVQDICDLIKEAL